MLVNKYFFTLQIVAASSIFVFISRFATIKVDGASNVILGEKLIIGTFVHGSRHASLRIWFTNVRGHCPEVYFLKFGHRLTLIDM